MAVPHPSRSCCCAAPTGPSRTNGGTACAAPHSRNRKPQQPRARRHTPKQVAKDFGKLAEYQAGEREVHSARRLTAPPSPLPRAPSLPTLLVPSVFAVGARRSSGEGGNSQRSTRTVVVALAARLVVHYCTRGSSCRAHRARADALIGSAKCARASTAVPRTAMWDRRVLHAHTLATRRNATSPFRRLGQRLSLALQAMLTRLAKAVVRLRRCSR